MFLNGTFPVKSWKIGFSSPGKPRNLVFADSGMSWKKHLNVCTNPVFSLTVLADCKHHVSLCMAS